MTAPDKCPATNPNAPVAPTDVLVTCDLARTTLYTLGPETMQLVLTHVDPPKPLTADDFEVHLTMDPRSAAAWASFILEAPTIQGRVTSGQIGMTTQTAPAADELARWAGRRE